MTIKCREALFERKRLSITKTTNKGARNMSLIITKKTKELFKARGLKTSEEAIKALGAEFEKLCKKTADNVTSNNLKTVKAVHVPKVNQHLS